MELDYLPPFTDDEILKLWLAILCEPEPETDDRAFPALWPETRKEN